MERCRLFSVDLQLLVAEICYSRWGCGCLWRGTATRVGPAAARDGSMADRGGAAPVRGGATAAHGGAAAARGGPPAARGGSPAPRGETSAAEATSADPQPFSWGMVWWNQSGSYGRVVSFCCLFLSFLFSFLGLLLLLLTLSTGTSMNREGVFLPFTSRCVKVTVSNLARLSHWRSSSWQILIYWAYLKNKLEIFFYNFTSLVLLN